MNFVKWVFLVASVKLVSTLQSSQQNTQPAPNFCSKGEACRHTSSRSFVNNEVYCCSNGGGLSVSNINNFVHCHCSDGSGTAYYPSANNNFVVNGQRLNERQVQRMIGDTRQTVNEDIQQFKSNLQAQLAAIRLRVNDLRLGLNNIRQQSRQRVQSQRQRIQAQMPRTRQQMDNLGQRLDNMFQ